MKKLLTIFSFLLLLSFTAFSQCSLSNYSSTLAIPIASFPYTNAQGITASVTTANITPLVNFSYTCGGNTFTCSSPAWWINSNTGVITFNFSVPVCNFTIIVNGTNADEEFYFTTNNGSVSVNNFCSSYFTAINAGTGVLCIPSAPSCGTIISIDNPVGATQYTLTHNGLGSGSRVSLLDCYTNTGCAVLNPNTIVSPTTAGLNFCAGDTFSLPYTKTGSYNNGNIFTAQLSSSTGSFTTPTAIGTLIDTNSGIIFCTIPTAAPAGSAYRIRVISSNPTTYGSNNGFDINIHNKPTVNAIATPTSVCAGGSLILAGSGASTYTWSGGVVNNNSFIPVVTSSYTVIGTDAFGCSNSSNVNVSVNPIPTLSIATLPNDTNCIGNAVTFSASGANTYAWSNGVQNAVAFNPISSGVYTVVGSSSAGCSASATLQLVVNPVPTINIVTLPSTTICSGNPVTLTANGGVSYSWTSSINNAIPFYPTSPNIYTVTGTNSFACTATNTVYIDVLPTPTVNLGNDTSICENAAYKLFTSTTGATYLWHNGNTTNNVLANQAGLYWVEVNLNGCKARDSIVVNSIALPIVNLGADTSHCEQTNVVLNATCPNCTYLWQDGNTSPVYSVSGDGWYIVTATNNGCKKIDSIYVNLIPLPYFSLGNDTAICIGDAILLNEYYSPTAKYLWQNNSTLYAFNVTQLGNYWLEITDNNCTYRDDINFTLSDNCNCPVFIPSAFSPNADGINDQFKLYNTNNILLNNFSVYNRFGEQIFTTSDIAINWDGYQKGIKCDLGIYYYIVKYKCLYNNEDILLKGEVQLVR